VVNQTVAEEGSKAASTAVLVVPPRAVLCPSPRLRAELGNVRAVPRRGFGPAFSVKVKNEPCV